MSAALTAAGTPATKTYVRAERFFFSGMALIILAIVFLGFARSYYLAGLFHAPLPNLLVHVHGAAFSSWILLLVIQTCLVASGRVGLHKRLGLVGFGLAGSMVIVGLWAATNSMIRHWAPGQTGIDVRAFYAVPVAAMGGFGTLTFFGFRERRRNPRAHKRLMLIATVALLDAAFGRWPIPASWWNLRTAQLCCYLLLLFLVCYDLWLFRRLQRSTVLGSALVVVLQQTAYLVGHSAFWQSFAAWAGRALAF